MFFVIVMGLGEFLGCLTADCIFLHHVFVTESVCRADQATTTAPTTTASTTTTVAPSPTPPGTPERGAYFVYRNGTECLLAQMGLQLNVSYFSRSQNKVKESFTSIPQSEIIHTFQSILHNKSNKTN